MSRSMAVRSVKEAIIISEKSLQCTKGIKNNTETENEKQSMHVFV
jgi:hypothetical protein